MNRYVYKDLNRSSLRQMMITHQFIMEADDDRWLDALINFLHTIIYKVDIDECDENKYVNLHSDILGQVYGQQKNTTYVYYRRVVHILATLNIIQINHSYEQGVNSKGYKINVIFEGDLVEETINNESINLKEDKLTKTAKRHESDILSLSFDTAKANQVIKRLHISKRLSITSWAFRLSNQMGLSATEDKNGRIYSAITGLNKEFRQCLSYQGQDLFSIDLKQAHPYFFIYLAGQRIKQNSKMDLKAYLATGKHADMERYITDVCSVNFIDTLYNQILKNKKNIERGELKLGILVEVYYQRIKKNKHKVAKAFFNLYPSVWDSIQAYKTKDYKDLAHKLMKIESRLMNRAVNELYKLHPDKLFLRLHDAIITTSDMVNITEEIINKLGDDIIGFAPMVSTMKFNVSKGEISDHDLDGNELVNAFTKYLARKSDEYIDRKNQEYNSKKITMDQYQDLVKQNDDELSVINLAKWLQKSMLMKF